MRGAGECAARSARGRCAFQTIEFATQGRKIEIRKGNVGVSAGEMS